MVEGAILSWLLHGGWKQLIAAVIAAGIAGKVSYEIGHWRGYDAGYAAHEAEAIKQNQEKLNEASRADDAMRRCLANPDCRLQDDGYKRHD